MREVINDKVYYKTLSRQEPKAFCLSDNSYAIAANAANSLLSF